jgi:hypothetical protein
MRVRGARVDAVSVYLDPAAGAEHRVDAVTCDCGEHEPELEQPPRHVRGSLQPAMPALRPRAPEQLRGKHHEELGLQGGEGA